jgi:excisionase family DNA binding protein
MEITTEKKKFERPYLNLVETAKYLGLAKQTVYQLVYQKKITHGKLNGRKLVFKIEDLDEYLEKHICFIKSADQLESEAVTHILTNQK